MIFINNTSHNPAYNLALEEYLVTRSDGRFAQSDVALLWSNTPTVVIGRNQNAAREIDRAYLEAHDISLVRRLSGGGAVYHDAGNINFTVIKRDARSLKNNFSFFTEPLVQTLKELGVEATFSGRNDVLVEGAKFSGNAQYSFGDTLLHHGTILFDSDMSVLGKVLTPKPRMEDLSTKGVKSHQSRVTNLSSCLTVDRAHFIEVLARNLVGCSAEEAEFAPVELNAHEIADVEALAQAKYATPEWTWGRSPEYNAVNQARFNAGNIMVCLVLENKVVRKLDIYGDYFEVLPIEEFAQKVVGHELCEVPDLLKKYDISRYIHALSNKEFLRLFEDFDNAIRVERVIADGE